jgi:hypothetical protein
LVVEHRHLARDLFHLPEAVVGVGKLRRVVVGEEVVAPGDPGGEDRVGHGVARADVVPGALQGLPDVALEVGDVVKVQRLDQLARDEQRDLRLGGDEDVVADGARGELGDRFVEGREGAQLDLDAVFLFERLEDGLVDVFGPVVELQRARLGLEAAGDRPVVGVDRQGDRVVGAGERQAARG